MESVSECSRVCIRNLKIQNSPGLKEISYGDRSRAVCVLNLHAWARKDAAVKCPGERTRLAPCMDLTTAWLYGLGNGTDFLANGTPAEQVLEAFKQGSADFFGRSEFDVMTAKLREWFCVHRIPQANHRSRHLIEERNAAMCRLAYNRKTHHLSTCGGNSTTAYPLAKLDQPPEELEAPLSREALDHLGASHDASAITLTCPMYMLLQPKPLQRALKEEHVPQHSIRRLPHSATSMPYLCSTLSWWRRCTCTLLTPDRGHAVKLALFPIFLQARFSAHPATFCTGKRRFSHNQRGGGLNDGSTLVWRGEAR